MPGRWSSSCCSTSSPEAGEGGQDTLDGVVEATPGHLWTIERMVGAGRRCVEPAAFTINEGSERVMTAQEQSLAMPDDIAQAVIWPESYVRLEEVVLPACAWLRENLPVGRAAIEGWDPMWVFSHHADMVQITLNQEVLFNGNFPHLPTQEYVKLYEEVASTARSFDYPSFMDVPEHPKFRASVMPHFQPASVRKHYEGLARKLAQGGGRRQIERRWGHFKRPHRGHFRRPNSLGAHRSSWESSLALGRYDAAAPPSHTSCGGRVVTGVVGSGSAGIGMSLGVLHILQGTPAPSRLGGERMAEVTGADPVGGRNPGLACQAPNQLAGDACR